MIQIQICDTNTNMKQSQIWYKCYASTIPSGFYWGAAKQARKRDTIHIKRNTYFANSNKCLIKIQRKYNPMKRLDMIVCQQCCAVQGVNEEGRMLAFLRLASPWRRKSMIQIKIQMNIQIWHKCNAVQRVNEERRMLAFLGLVLQLLFLSWIRNTIQIQIQLQ